MTQVPQRQPPPGPPHRAGDTQSSPPSLQSPLNRTPVFTPLLRTQSPPAHPISPYLVPNPPQPTESQPPLFLPTLVPDLLPYTFPFQPDPTPPVLPSPVTPVIPSPVSSPPLSPPHLSPHIPLTCPPPLL
ncbi:hypothetical protein CesoFtcFv8_022665 [Champsocephalus esox]|uniref:Uncharacterized protein n=1 Tax=Champsocephalus esox TaxID=159716 RepID=A0AAN8GFL6_9TELE|nr:hypothetical protein CesoFtcFv8_022665 [Champsocephalus esox]